MTISLSFTKVKDDVWHSQAFIFGGVDQVETRFIIEKRSNRKRPFILFMLRNNTIVNHYYLETLEIAKETAWFIANPQKEETKQEIKISLAGDIIIPVDDIITELEVLQLRLKRKFESYKVDTTILTGLEREVANLRKNIQLIRQ